MGIQIGSNFSLQTALPLDDRFICESIEELYEIPMESRYEGMMCYVVGERNTLQLIGGIENIHWEYIQSERAEGNVYVGIHEPDQNKIWVDTSAETLSYSVPSYQAIFQEFRDSIKELRTEIDVLKRTVQDILDNGIIVAPPSEDEEKSDYLFLTEDGETLILEDGTYLLQEIAVLDQAAYLLSEMGEQLLMETGEFMICE